MNNRINFLIPFKDGEMHQVTCRWDAAQSAVTAPNSKAPLDRSAVRIANDQDSLDNAATISLALAAGYQRIG
jgi:hypothetical protein